MEALEQQIVLFLQELMQTIGWAGVVVAMSIESMAIPLPSEVIMPLAGWMLGQAAGLSAWQTVLWGGFYGALGCVIGSAIAYFLGAYGGRPLLERYGPYLLIHTHHLETADRWFERWGEHAVFWSRLLPVVRTFISVPAGVSRVPFWRFLVLTFVGSFPWCAGLAYAGYLFGQHWERIRAVMRPFDIPILIALAAGVLWFFWKAWRERAQQRAAA